MSKKNRIDIYMGIVGQAYVDKETALKTLNAAKKNVLDVKYILYLIDRSYMADFAILHSKDYPLLAPHYEELYDTVKGNAEQAQTVARQIRETLEAAIVNNRDNEYRVNKLQALLDVLKENDIDNDFSNGGNTTTADANVAIVNALKAELDDIKTIALELLATNEQRVIECEQLYDAALEEFKSYLPEEYETPEEASDRIEEELHRRLRVLANNLEEVQATTDAINEVSENVQTAMNDILNATTPDSEDSADIVQKVDSADINAALDGAVSENDPIKYTRITANEHNAALEGAVYINDIKDPAIYTFISYNNAEKEVQYGTGKVKVIEMRAGGATVEVIENNANDPNAENFVGRQYNVALATGTEGPVQLNTLKNEPVDIWITYEEESPETRYTIEEAIAHNDALEGAVHPGDNILYTEATANEHNAALEGAKHNGDSFDPAIYTFISYNNAEKEVQYGTGKVKVIEMRAGGATVEVIENNANDPNAENFVGRQYNVALATGTEGPVQLNTLENEPVDIWITYTEKVYTTDEANEYNAALENAVHADDPIDYYTKETAAEYNASLPGAVSEEVVMINADAEKPTTANPAPMDMTELTESTEMNLIYPSNWERIENGLIVSPVVKDWNGIGVSFELIGEITIDGVQYRVTNIALGSGNYTIEFV